MALRGLSLERVRAARLLRAGATLEEASRVLGLAPDSVRRAQDALHDVPDDVLGLLERVLGDNEKLRRLIAGLQNLPLPERDRHRSPHLR